MHPTRTPRPQLLMRLQRWWKGNWSELPAWWKVKSRGGYVTGIAAGAALCLLYIVGQRAARGQSVLDLLPAVLVAMALTLAVVIPATFAVARMSHRKCKRRKHHG